MSASVDAKQADGRDRLEYLQQMSALLWPGSEVRSTVQDGDPPPLARFLLLPGPGTPRLLVPAHRRPAAAAVLGYGEQTGAGRRAATQLLAGGLRCGLGLLLSGRRRTVVGSDRGLIGHLEQVLGEPLLVSLHLGPPRANRKPVLQLLRADGRVVAFAKVGHDDLTRRLVRTEADALQRLSTVRLPGVRVPEVLHQGSWGDLHVLVQSPLPLRHRRQTSPVDVARAMAAVADIDRGSDAPLVGGPYWSVLAGRIAALPDVPAAAGLVTAFTQLGDLSRHDVFPTGSWHGDWAPWNMAGLPGELAVWDWERFAVGVPQGFDALHCDLQTRLVVNGRPPREAASATVQHAPELLAPMGVRPRIASLIALYYLTELATRYVEDGQAEAGARFGRVGDWLTPVLSAEIAGALR